MPTTVRVILMMAVWLALACAAPPSPRAPSQPGAAESALPPATASASGTSGVAADRTAPQQVRYGVQNSASYAAAYIGLDQGYFREEGIDLDLVPFSDASQMIPALATDQVEAAGIGVNPALWNAVARGVPLKLVLDLATFRPGHGTTALVVRKAVYESGRGRQLDDLQGLTLAITPPGKATTVACALSAALQRVGATLDDLTIQPLPTPDMVPALANGAVDAALLGEPFQTQALRQGTVARAMGEDEMYPNSHWVW